MKKVLVSILSLLVAIAITTPASAATIQLKIDSINVVSDVKPEIKNDRTMVPLRIISENLGATVYWTSSEIIISQTANHNGFLKVISNTVV